MAKQGTFGKVIPSLGEIEKIDGKKLVDCDGDEWPRNLIEVNKSLGGGYELATMGKKENNKSQRKE